MKRTAKRIANWPPGPYDYGIALEHLEKEVVDDGLYSLGWYLAYTNGDKNATLDGKFTADDLLAIATVMYWREKK